MIPPRLEPLLRADSPAGRLSVLFHEAGHELALVGGSVRDALLGRPIDDLDFTTDAHPDRIKEIVHPWAHDLYLAGQRFGTIGAIHDGHIYEITTYRSEVYSDDSRKPQVSYSSDIGEDLSRRDFTVNAMALRIGGGDPELLDPHGGLNDLFQGILRTPLDPEIAFGDDPLRMLRLFRFLSTLGFAPTEEALGAVSAMADRLQIISAERIRQEFSKLLVGDHVADALVGMVQVGLAEQFIPEFTALELQQDPHHRHKDVLAHSIAVVAKTSPILELRLAALLHDIGKPDTRAFTPAGVTFHHHEVVGARMARRRMKELRFSSQEVKDVSDLVFLHMRPHTFKMGWTDSAVRRYVRDAGPLLDMLNELVRCDVTTRNERRARAIQRGIDELEERIADLRQKEELDALRPPIDGTQVMEYLSLEPGPRVGQAMRMLLEHRIEDGPYSEEEAFRLLDDWNQNRD
ncbi:MAG: CCA tRNA nucleotidyltransferase [bacterium]|nr:CCA tRNA nucleotidyltransferase [bacterium]